MKRRSGMSMAEVLVALFILALGTIAILTMFPLGMYHMGQALKDDRTAQSASQADALMRTYWRQAVVEAGGAGEPFYQALNDPNNSVPGSFLGGFPPISNSSTEPSYPVIVDPMGWFAPWGVQNSPTQQYWVGSNAIPIPRRNMNWAGSASQAQRLCSMMDGFSYQENGLPSNSGGVVERELRYNWLWVLQRPDNTALTTANMTVVVFDRRASQYAPANAELIFTGVGMQPFTTSLVIPAGGLPIQKGGWIMDATYAPPGTPGAPNGLKHAFFYRVASATDLGGQTALELQTPIRRSDGSSNGYAGTLVYLAGVSEVFERPPLTPNDF